MLTSLPQTNSIHTLASYVPLQETRRPWRSGQVNSGDSTLRPGARTWLPSDSKRSVRDQTERWFRRYDIKVSRLPDSSPVSLRIEVRTSRWKHEGLLDLHGQRIFYWGWRVKSRGRHDPDWDYLVGVAKHANEESDARFLHFRPFGGVNATNLDLRDTIDVKPGNVC